MSAENCAHVKCEHILPPVWQVQPFNANTRPPVRSHDRKRKRKKKNNTKCSDGKAGRTCCSGREWPGVSAYPDKRNDGGESREGLDEAEQIQA